MGLPEQTTEEALRSAVTQGQWAEWKLFLQTAPDDLKQIRRWMERLMPFVQHKPECQKAAGRRGFAHPRCTCGLEAALAADQPAEAGGEVGGG